MSSEPGTTVQPEVGSRPPSVVRAPIRVLLAVGLGGAFGGLARYGIGRSWPVGPGEFPWSTVLVSVSGSLVLGVLLVERWPPTLYVRPFAGIGLCGGYTTWSTFMTETALLLRDGRTVVAIGYLTTSLIAGLLATYAGIGLARLWPLRAGRSAV
jgi:CrcB protein